MAAVHFSVSAREDLLKIGAYTIRTWGEAQAARYLGDLEKCTNMLARSPGLGRSCDWIRPGLHRFEQGRHVIFYRTVKSGIRIIRILHQSMMLDRQRFEDKDPGA
ncbi:MAG: type II toxin-antitoxin system RelE/ParE family toxin [Terracidiphilus sp.]